MIPSRALLLAGLVALAVSGCSTAPPPAPIIPAATPAAIGHPRSSWVPAQPPPPATKFGDGKYEVGPDIAPGRYKTAGSQPGGKCYWARLKDLSGALTSTIAMGYGDQGPNVIVIEPSDKGFETRDCGVWAWAGSK